MLRKFIKTFLIVLLLCLFMAPNSHGTGILYNMWAKVYSWDGTMNNRGQAELTPVVTGITYKVLQAGSDTVETLYEYGDRLFTSMVNPVTTTNYASSTVSQCGGGQICFRVDPGETNNIAVDLIVVDTAGGYTAFIEDFDSTTHTVVIDERPNIMHHGTIWFTSNSNSETDTGIDFDYDTMIHDVRIEIVTTDTGETLDVGLLASGTNGDANGFLTLRSVANKGYPADTGIITDGTIVDFTAVTTYGELLVAAVTGTDTTGGYGGRSYLGHIVLSANEQSLTYTETSGGDTAAGYIHYYFTRMR